MSDEQRADYNAALCEGKNVSWLRFIRDMREAGVEIPSGDSRLRDTFFRGWLEGCKFSLAYNLELNQAAAKARGE